ncbi:cytochrome b [Paludibacterium paludis]|uniref:Cytochrome b n=1 Tax=Paludibacterium paludis TaxID=1225769 RepID=A0A918P5B7_9NEIS|nr:cytochrome b [Paludibacterium paludis]GGY21368.1 cytochrome b [Paludibacterium paludis]
MLKNSQNSYGRVARLLHWLSALAVIAALVFIEMKDLFPKGTPMRDFMKAGHFQAGVTVLLLVLPRLAWRFANPLPRITPAPDKRIALASHAAHWALYALMLALPLLGIIALQNFGREISYFGITLPTLVSVSEDAAGNLMDLHETLGNLIMWLAIAHAVAAFWHHFSVKDDTLTRLTGPLR